MLSFLNDKNHAINQLKRKKELRKSLNTVYISQNQSQSIRILRDWKTRNMELLSTFIELDTIVRLSSSINTL